MSQPTKEQQEFINALENLIRIATRSKVHVVGFTYCPEPPLLISFANGANDPTDIRVYEMLIKLRKQQVDGGGQVEQNYIGEVN